jgi:hypothetical protein
MRPPAGPGQGWNRPVSPRRIPSDDELLEIIFQASRYIKYTRRLLEKYPEGRAPHGATSARSRAIDDLQDVWSSSGAEAPDGWPEPICSAVEELTPIVDDLRRWSTPYIPPNRPPFDDEFIAADEWPALSRLVELVAILESALDDEPEAPAEYDEHAVNQPHDVTTTVPTHSLSSDEHVPTIGDRLDDLITALRRSRAAIQASFLEYMKSRDSATTDEIASQVHGDEGTSEGAIRANVKRVNEALGAKGLPIRFRIGSGFVFKDEQPE